ncbi:hypothetical protein CEV31_0641 [Brucella thiophenivorans]|uniref:Uncharacterized protein n=1 Tax=Brucella thiophenivorans TaxID=571255 RepID=A0A256G2Z0_9HYPH|nr:hypothetical protein CEV31_0641 [Brucella thiophenivorans]
MAPAPLKIKYRQHFSTPAIMLSLNRFLALASIGVRAHHL